MHLVCFQIAETRYCGILMVCGKEYSRIDDDMNEQMGKEEMLPEVLVCQEKENQETIGKEEMIGIS
jgi:hypothetical protein